MKITKCLGVYLYDKLIKMELPYFLKKKQFKFSAVQNYFFERVISSRLDYKVFGWFFGMYRKLGNFYLPVSNNLTGYFPFSFEHKCLL